MAQRHFATGSFTSHASWLKEEDYSKGLDNFVVACVDCMIINPEEEMLLGKRAIEPQPDWWIIGGKMLPGETFAESAVRNVKRELGLKIDGSRFVFLQSIYSLVWSRRQQVPKNNGCHMVSIPAILKINNSEVMRIKANFEYNNLQWIKPEDIDARFHPAVQCYAKDVIVFLLKNSFS